MIILLVIIGLSLLILGHEAGHFVVAKLSGMRVNEFGFGFPPRLFGIRRYKGKVLTPIEKDTSVDIGETAGVVVMEEKTREIDVIKKETVWRFFWRKERSDEYLDGFEGGTIYSMNLLPFGGFVRIAGENDRLRSDDSRQASNGSLFSSKPIWKRSLVVLAGVIANFILGWLILSSVFMVGVPNKVVVGSVRPDSPAEIAGMKAGDIISDFESSEELVEFVNSKMGQPVALKIFRDGESVDVNVAPEKDGITGKYLLGVFVSGVGIEKRGFFGAFAAGFMESLNISKETITAFSGMLKSIFAHWSVPRDVVGPVGIVSIASETGKLGFLYFLQLLALISLNLAIMNLLPFPALDGGRFLLLIIEKIKGSPLPKMAEVWINAAGFLILIGLMLLVTIRDVGRL
jgi:regulator of sigma E protease